MWKKLEKATLLELELLEVFVSLNKRPDFWKSLCEFMHIIFHCRTGIITSQENVCFHQKFVSKFTHTIIIVGECFLIFWFCIKENQVYYNWITYRLVLLVSIQLLFSRCIKYAETRGFLWSVFSRMWIESYPNTDQRKPVFWRISCIVLVNIFSHYIDLRKNTSCVSARKLFVSKYMSCLTAQKLNAWKLEVHKLWCD